MAATMNLAKMKLNDLKKELKERGLPISGNKSDLIARLKVFMEANDPPNTDDILADNSSSSQTIGEGVEPDIELGGVDEEIAVDEILKDDEALPLDTDDPPDNVLDDKLDDDALEINTAVGTSPDSAQSKEKASLEALTEATSSLPDDHDPAVKSLKPSLTASERMMIRAKKFGVTSDEMKKKTREERFGSSSSAVSSTSDAGSGVIGTSIKATDVQRLKERAERFGGSVAPSMSKVEETEKLLKRQERFGSADSAFSKKVQRLEESDRKKERLKRFGGDAPSVTKSSGDMDEKRKRRAERFGQSTVGGGGDMDEKKRKRLERFGSSI